MDTSKLLDASNRGGNSNNSSHFMPLKLVITLPPLPPNLFIRLPRQFASTYLYSWGGEGHGQSKVSFPRTHNTMTWPGLEPEPLDAGVWSTDCKTGASPFMNLKRMIDDLFFFNLSSYFWVFLLLTRFSFFSLASSLFLLWGCRQSPESLRSQDLSATREVRYCG